MLPPFAGRPVLPVASQTAAIDQTGRSAGRPRTSTVVTASPHWTDGLGHTPSGEGRGEGSATETGRDDLGTRGKNRRYSLHSTETQGMPIETKRLQDLTFHWVIFYHDRSQLTPNSTRPSCIALDVLHA